MSLFATQAYNLLSQAVLANITPALAAGGGAGPGVRLPIGNPEIIPDTTFIARLLNAPDGFSNAQITHDNIYIQQAIDHHTVFGLNPITVGSIEDILDHYSTTPATPIGRIRLVSHGNNAFLFIPLFNGGRWDQGIQEGRLEAFKTSDGEGLRFLMLAQGLSVFHDISPTVIAGLDALHAPALVPFGHDVYAMSDDTKKLIASFCDRYQLTNGPILFMGSSPPAVLPFVNDDQKAVINQTLDTIEKETRTKLIGQTINGTLLTDAHLTALKTAIMSYTPKQLGFFGPSAPLNPNVIADLAIAMTPPQNNRNEDALRNAIVSNTIWPMFTDNLNKIRTALLSFDLDAMDVGGGINLIANGPNDDVDRYLSICSDIFYLNQSDVTIGGALITDPQRALVREGLRAIAIIVAKKITAATPGATSTKLTRFRTAVETLTARQTFAPSRFVTALILLELTAANHAIQQGFRAKLDKFKTLLTATSNIDIRGCLVGATPSFLVKLRDFLGSTATISAPDWFQTFPSLINPFPTWAYPFIYDKIDTFIAGSIPVSPNSPGVTSSADIKASFNTWKALIDFDPHFSYIGRLFAPAATTLNFALLEWKIFQTGGAGAGIPVLRIGAEGIDDIATLDLGGIIERFARLFELPMADRPSEDVRTRLSLLQPHLVTFKQIKTDAAALAAAATPAQLGPVADRLSRLATAVAAIANMPAVPPAAPLAPGSHSLADIRSSVTNFQSYFTTTLDADLTGFFAAVRLQLSHANAGFRYCLNVGVPVLITSTAWKSKINVVIMVSDVTENEVKIRSASAYRNWMRIQWSGTEAQMAAMNATINTVPTGTSDERAKAGRSSMLIANEGAIATTIAEINPMQGFQDHIKHIP